MSKRKNQNSILVLATLGVYLGLVLVGATPQVLAQAAMARQFNVKDEIEVKDDLDKKPDDNLDGLVSSIDDYFREIEAFVGDLQKLHQIEKFDTGYDTFTSERIVYEPCPETGGLISEQPKENLDRWLAPAIIDAKYRTENWTWLAKCLSSDKFTLANRTEAKVAGFKVSYDKSELTYQIYVVRSSPADANILLENFQQAFNLCDFADESKVIKVLHKHTSFSSSDNQVFIVTRLPRAGLDALLASDAK